MPASSPIDAAYQRGKILLEILKMLRDRALAQPSDKKWAELGLCSEYTTKSEVVSELNASFDDLFGLLAHVAVLDMAASFELASQRRLGTRVGAARSTLREFGKKRDVPDYFERLIKDSDDFSGLKSIINLIANDTDGALLESFEAVREARNNFAHGTKISSPPTIEADDVRNTLNTIFNKL